MPNDSTIAICGVCKRDLNVGEEHVCKGLDLNPKQEEFCQNYINNEETFSNATLSYAVAYEIDAFLHGTEDQKANYFTCAVSASRLLKNDKIRSRLVDLLNESLEDRKVDAELAKMVFQNKELNTKLGAIREYNKLKQRITEKTDVKLSGMLDVGVLFDKSHEK